LVAAWLILRPSAVRSPPVSGLEPSEDALAEAPEPAPDPQLASDASRVQVPEEPLPIESAAESEPESRAAVTEAPEVAPTTEPPVVHFPHGRPTPNWVFEQKYAGMSESRYALAREEVAAAYGLASKAAFLECWETGAFEIVPAGQSNSYPGDLIVGGRSIPGSKDSCRRTIPLPAQSGLQRTTRNRRTHKPRSSQK
jgi:hypothetical protein